jgi:hypothetical protein
MKRLFLLAILFCLTRTMSVGQVVLNSGFTSGTANRGCTPETNPESVYGGPTGNTVAEIDVLVGLCQTINGLVPGTVYNLNYVASRRLGGCPGPNPATIGVTIANLNTTDSRTNTVWALSPSTFLFTATATSHTLNIFHQFVVNTTCGFIIDDITITVAVPFAVSVSNLEAFSSENGGATIAWTSSAEPPSTTYSVSKSEDLSQWHPVADVSGRADPSNPSYAVHDWPETGRHVYYRLQAVDPAGLVQDLGIASILTEDAVRPIVSPNPCSDRCWIAFPGIGDAEIVLLDPLGKEVVVPVLRIEDDRVGLDLRECLPGFYLLRVVLDGEVYVVRVLVGK